MTLHSKRQLKALIAENRIGEAVTILLKVTAVPPLSGLYDEVITQSSHFHQYQEEQRRGTRSDADLQVFIARIRRALLQIIDRIPEADLPSTDTDKVNKYRKFVWPIALFVILAVSISIVLTQLASVSSPGDALDPLEMMQTTFDLTVQVRGSGGDEDILLTKNGGVYIHLGDNHRYAAVEEFGEAHFRDLPGKYREGTYRLSLAAEGFEARYPARKYALDSGELQFEIRPVKIVEQETAEPEEQRPSRSTVHKESDRAEQGKAEKTESPQKADHEPPAAGAVETPPNVQPELAVKRVSCNIGKPNTLVRFEDHVLGKQIHVRSDASGNIAYSIAADLVGNDIKVFFSDPGAAMISNSQWVEITLKPSGCIQIP